MGQPRIPTERLRRVDDSKEVFMSNTWDKKDVSPAVTSGGPLWIYPDEVERLRVTLEAYRSGDIALDRLQAVLAQSAQHIVAYEERWLREELIRAEAELETVRCTVDEDSVRGAALEIISGLASVLESENG